MNRDVVAEKIQLYTAKLDATRRQLEVVKTSFFKAKTATTKIKWPAKPPTEKMRLLLRIVSLFLNFSTLTRVFALFWFSRCQFYGTNANTTKRLKIFMV